MISMVFFECKYSIDKCVVPLLIVGLVDPAAE